MVKPIKNLIKISLAFVFFQCFLSGCAIAQDFSADKVVLEQFGKLKNEKFNKDDVCIKRLKESAKIIVIGFFVKDAGCRLDGAFINSVYFENSADLSQKALSELGWAKANRQQRERLAKLWIEKGLLAFSALPNHTFGAVSANDGKIKIIVSLEFPPGTTSRHVPEIFIFDEDGNLASKSYR